LQVQAVMVLWLSSGDEYEMGKIGKQCSKRSY
jgi:hypothetical protein